MILASAYPLVRNILIHTRTGSCFRIAELPWPLTRVFVVLFGFCSNFGLLGSAFKRAVFCGRREVGAHRWAKDLSSWIAKHAAVMFHLINGNLGYIAIGRVRANRIPLLRELMSSLSVASPSLRP